VRVAALVPFKCFTRAKQRLRARFSDAQVEELTRAMLADVLAALQGVPTLERVTVLTDDEAVAEVAAGAGAAVGLEKPDPGLNPAIELATRRLEDEGFDASLVVLGDLPLLQPADVEAVLEAGQQHPVVVVPAVDGGTALLYRRPAGRIPTQFGVDSFARHASAAGSDFFALDGLDEVVRIDIDTPEDMQRLLASERPCRTRETVLRFER
jgi:2-phospho-L-lactate guanylyltransferase